MNEACNPPPEIEPPKTGPLGHELSPGKVFGIGQPPKIDGDIYTGDDDFFTNKWSDVAFGD